MEVVALVPRRDHVSTRYRISPFGRYLASQATPLVLEPLARGLGPRFAQATRSRRGQLVLLQRKLLPVWQLKLLRRNSQRLVYDFDDAVYQRDSFHPNGPYSRTRAKRFRAVCAMADLVLAGNEYLAAQARRYARRGRVHVLPTCVDPAPYPSALHQAHRPTRLVWIGSASTYRTLEASRPVLEAIGQAIPDASLRVICDRFPHFEHLPVEPAPWSAARERLDLSASDIGISWIPDDRWSRGKCGLKVLQYMAAGLPVLASPVGVHRRIIARETGFLPAEVADWIDRVALLAGDHDLRERMGREGRSRLERHFHVKVWGPILAGLLREVWTRR